MFVRCLALALMAANLVGCADAQEPPLSELPLRDALDADPEVISWMSQDAQTSLASRLHDTQQTQSEAGFTTQVVPSDEAMTTDEVEALVVSLDRVRETNHEDVLVTALLDTTATDPLLLAPPVGVSKPASTPIDLSMLEGAVADSPTKDAEARALAGEAGALLADLAAQAHTNRFVRVSGWPVGAVVSGKNIYVNASWLVAMAAKSEKKDVPVMTTPTLQPQKVPGSPYSPPASMSECAQLVQSDCQACVDTGQCDESDISDISDPVEACKFILAQSERSLGLCAVVLFGAGSLRECLTNFGSQCVPGNDSTAAGIDSTAALFKGSSSCGIAPEFGVTDFDSCLQSARSYEWSSSVCSVAGTNVNPGRKALMLLGPLAWLVIMGRFGRRGTWKAK